MPAVETCNPGRVETWGAALYGKPCRACGYEWPTSWEAALPVIAGVHERYGALLSGATGNERHPELEWTVGAYVCHVVDNLRIWAERLAGAGLGGTTEVASYDGEALASARGYAFVSLAGALWSLRNAAQEWQDAVRLASACQVVLVHDARGEQRWSDVVRNNAHDAFHHEWDIRRSLA